jgi:hypothetical protein
MVLRALSEARKAGICPCSVILLLVTLCLGSPLCKLGRKLVPAASGGGQEHGVSSKTQGSVDISHSRHHCRSAQCLLCFSDSNQSSLAEVLASPEAWDRFCSL